MAKRRDVAVWLADGMARLIVGALPAAKPSRWAVEGVIVEEVGVGIWLKANTIQEFRPLNKRVKQVNWMFKSDQLLIRWDAIITIQAFEGGEIQIGIKAVAE
jgi:hypothetical protein